MVGTVRHKDRRRQSSTSRTVRPVTPLPAERSACETSAMRTPPPILRASRRVHRGSTTETAIDQYGNGAQHRTGYGVRVITTDDIRRWATALPEVEEITHFRFRVPVFKVRGRTFVGLGKDETTAVFCVSEREPDNAAADDPATYEAVRRRDARRSFLGLQVELGSVANSVVSPRNASGDLSKRHGVSRHRSGWPASATGEGKSRYGSPRVQSQSPLTGSSSQCSGTAARPTDDVTVPVRDRPATHRTTSRTGAISFVTQSQRGRNRDANLDAGARGPAFVNRTKDEPDGDRNGGHDDPADDRGDRRGSGREGNDEVDHSGDEARDHNSGHGGIDLHGDSPFSLRALSSPACRLLRIDHCEGDDGSRIRRRIRSDETSRIRIPLRRLPLADRVACSLAGGRAQLPSAAGWVLRSAGCARQGEGSVGHSSLVPRSWPCAC